MSGSKGTEGMSPQQVGSGDMAESPKSTIRWDNGLRADAERCAKARGISVAEFVRQSIAHYVAWCAARDEASRTTEDPAP